MSKLSCVDLCSGLGGFSQAMVDRQWDVVRIDIEPWLPIDVCADVRRLPIRRSLTHLLVASPPCVEYAKRDMPWFRDAVDPDTSIWSAVVAARAQLGARWWVIENVRGAQRFHGRADYRSAGHYFWTNLPLFPVLPQRVKKGNVPGWGNPLRPWQRAKLPYCISNAIADLITAIEQGE